MLKIDYKFKDVSLRQKAMTHSSYANEHHGTHLDCNERLEFLGDSVLGFVTADYLYTHYPELPEGELTKLRAAVVCEGALCEIARELGIPEEIRLDFIGLQRYFEENGITHSFMTTQVGRQFALEMDCKSLRYLSVGGEKLVPCEPPKDYKFINAYGPTEATIFTTVFEVDKYYPNVPIGKALDNVKLYITDKLGHMLPPGACGELMITGWQVSRGYLNKPEKTAEVYTKNLYDDTPGYEVMYHSGDVARFLPDGNIQIIGRKDSQVKIRGFRIELSEVEEVIRRYEGIRDATVVAFDDPNGGKYIAAYVVSDSTVDINALNDFIKETKPAYMVPAVTMQIDKIPLNQNQKVNKKALPLPEKKAAEIIKPENEVQQILFDCIAEVLGYTDFGITTDIYEAGLTSITAIKLNILISKAFDIVIKTSDIKNHPNDGRICKNCGKRKQKGSTGKLSSYQYSGGDFH